MIKSTINLIQKTLLITTTAVCAHHILRKCHNPEVKLSDYLIGVENKITQVQQANKSWLHTYQSYSDKNQHNYQKQQNHTKSNQENQSNKCSKGNKSSKKTAYYEQPIQLASAPQAPQKNSMRVTWVSGVANMSHSHSPHKNGTHKHGIDEHSHINKDQFSVVAIDENRQLIWQTSISERVHDIVIQPVIQHSDSQRHVAVMGRRPSEFFWIMACDTGEIVHHLQADYQRHFYGHACYSLDGRLLYVAENDTESYQGIIGLYDVVKGYKKINEFSTHGIGPHEIFLHPDGDKLIIANGGIQTDRASREELNLDSMQPSLVYMSLAKDNLGAVLQQIQPQHNQMSIRHISVVDKGEFYGMVAIGIQFQGEKHRNMPLLLTHTFGDDDMNEYYNAHSADNSTYEPSVITSDWRQYHQYIASVKVNSNSNLICISSPIGGYVSVFDMQTKHLVGSIKLVDCAGISAIHVSQINDNNTRNDNTRNKKFNASFLVSDGQGGLTTLTTMNEANKKIVTHNTHHINAIAFDNHMQYVTAH